MADQLRGAVTISRREVAPVLAIAVTMVLGSAHALLVPKELTLPRGTVAPHLVPVHKAPFLWLNANTSQGSPHVLIVPKELILPPGKSPPFFVPGPPKDKLRQNADTTQDTPKTLIKELVEPVGENAPHFPPLRRWWQPPDSSQSTPIVDRPDQKPPLFNVPFWRADQLRPVIDTTRGTPKPLIADATPPFPTAPQFTILYRPSVADTSQSSYGTAYGLLPMPPGQSTPTIVQQFVWQTVDTSQVQLPLALGFAFQQCAFQYGAFQVDFCPPPGGGAAQTPILWKVGAHGLATKITQDFRTGMPADTSEN